MATPVYDALAAFADKHPRRFCMPGHKGFGFEGVPALSAFYPYDVTELSETDVLSAPEGFLKDAQEAFSRTFGAHETCMLVNGSTVGILAMFLGRFQEGDRILVDRNCHKSVLSALILGGFEPVFLKPEFDSDFLIPAQYQPETIEAALRENSEIKGVFLTSPNYFGICQDIQAIATILKPYGIPLLIDEAHGAHFCFHPRFPKPAISAGADLCVQSMHKTLRCPNQTALLHVSANCRSVRRVKDALSMVQTTSPSFPLLALMDLARDELEQNGTALYDRLFQTLDGFYQVCRGLSHLRILETEFQDRSRLVLNVSGASVSGHEAARILEEKHNIYIEMADENNLVLIATPQNTQEDFDCLLDALQGLDRSNTGRKPATPEWNKILDNPLRMRPKNVYGRPHREIPVADSAGEICAQNVVSFPPCVPIVTYGEEIGSAAAEYILKNNIQETIFVV